MKSPSGTLLLGQVYKVPLQRLSLQIQLVLALEILHSITFAEIHHVFRLSNISYFCESKGIFLRSMFHPCVIDYIKVSCITVMFLNLKSIFKDLILQVHPWMLLIILPSFAFVVVYSVGGLFDIISPCCMY